MNRRSHFSSAVVAAIAVAAVFGITSPPALAQNGASCADLARQVETLQQSNDALRWRLDQLAKAIDDVAWHHRVGEVAVVDKWRIVGPPRANVKNPNALGANNPVRFYTYTFVPRDRKPGEKLPMIILPHGGVHADFTTYHTHIIRELMAQGYVVVAPEYRGSTGYGRAFMEMIDYGGREIDDTHAAKEWALQNFDFVDPNRVGLLGWSHGGLIVLMEAFNRPDEYRAVFAGVPVSNLVMRMGYLHQGYRDLFSAEYHIGKTVREDIEEYKRRSPVWHAHRLQIPLRIHTTTNDDDVNYIEVEHLIQALKAAGKEFEYKVYPDAPGGHSFDRMDDIFAREARAEIWRFLARYLNPPRPIR